MEPYKRFVLHDPENDPFMFHKFYALYPVEKTSPEKVFQDQKGGASDNKGFV